MCPAPFIDQSTPIRSYLSSPPEQRRRWSAEDCLNLAGVLAASRIWSRCCDGRVLLSLSVSGGGGFSYPRLELLRRCRAWVPAAQLIRWRQGVRSRRQRSLLLVRWDWDGSTRVNRTMRRVQMCCGSGAGPRTGEGRTAHPLLIGLLLDPVCCDNAGSNNAVPVTDG